jgi:hypothetical protein
MHYLLPLSIGDISKKLAMLQIWLLDRAQEFINILPQLKEAITHP